MTETDIRDVILVWISDSLSGVWSENKGVCHAEVGLETLRMVLYECDKKRYGCPENLMCMLTT